MMKQINTDVAFADALCDSYSGTADDLRAHAMKRYRGIQGQNGTACDECQARAKRMQAHLARIMFTTAANSGKDNRL